VTAVVASVQSVDRTPLGMYAVVAVLFVVALAVYLAVGARVWARFERWLAGRLTARRAETRVTTLGRWT
jgi:hypothetical protein